MFLLATRPSQERLLAAALDLTANTALAPDDYEWELLDDFVRGMLTIDEVVGILDVRAELNQLAEKL